MRKDKQLKRRLYSVLLLVFICGGQIFEGTGYALASETEALPAPAAVTEIDLGEYQSQMKVGEKQLLSVTVLPAEAADTKITYSSGNPGVAEINGAGRITALNVGMAEITVSSGGISQRFTLTVVSGEVPVKDIDLGDYQSEMKVGERQLLGITILPENATDTKVSYSSGNPVVAEINEMGRITAQSEGKTEITAACGGVSKKFTLTVAEANTAVRDIDLGDCPAEIEVGTSQLLSVTPIPTDAGEQSVTYKSSDTKIATVNEIGRVTGIAIGKADITVSCGKVKKKFSLKVIEAKDENEKIPVKDIEISDHEDELEVDKTMNLSVTVLPANATDTTVTYRSSDEKIATVNSSGEVKGIGAGKVTITVSAGNVSKSVDLTVKYATAKIEMNTTYLVLKEGDTFQLSAKVLPATADQGITYESENPDIISVTGGGLVTAKKAGSGTELVKNSDTSTAVMVIVNLEGRTQEPEQQESAGKTQTEYGTEVSVKDCPLVSSDMLRYLYENGKVLTLHGDGYLLQIDGKDISNWSNEFYTDIEFKEEEKGTSFCVNREQNICGRITLQLEEKTVSGEYLYLYNSSKGKYELLDQKEMHLLKLDSAGKYLITEKKLGNGMVKFAVVLVTAVVLLGLVFVYIGVKKKYWFW